ncbi:MAG: hypothetical protein EOO65_05765, partial [Methanosarcinales archaeon]
FTLGIRGLGPLTEEGSGLLCTAAGAVNKHIAKYVVDTTARACALRSPFHAPAALTRMTVGDVAHPCAHQLQGCCHGQSERLCGMCVGVVQER